MRILPQEVFHQKLFITINCYYYFSYILGEDVGSITLGPGSALEDMLAEKLERHRDREEQNKLSAKVLVMQPILRFLQLLCENHNRNLQTLLRNQNNKTNYNLVSETLMFLDCICGSTTGGLGLLGLYINENNVALINQTLETLTEYCQGPCHDNQNCIATHESNGLDIITALILNDINPLGKTRMDLVLELKNNASKLLLAIMESRGDSENAERILYNMNPKPLVDVACRAFHQETMDDEDDGEDTSTEGDDGVSPKESSEKVAAYLLDKEGDRENKERSQGQPALFWVSSHMSLWSNILFNCAVLINLIVAFFYPFLDSVPNNDSGRVTVSGEVRERACDSLVMCIVTTLNQGLRNGGGIGDILRAPSSNESLYVARVVYDLLFFFIVIIIVLNLIFGVIIDTFADLRSEKQQKELTLKDNCFICGKLIVCLNRSAFDNKTVSFEEHVKCEHNMWHYLYFIVLVKVKDPTEFTGPESYVYAMVKDRNLDWFPRLRAMSLSAEEGEGEQIEYRTLQTQLEKTQELVSDLVKQLTELRDQANDRAAETEAANWFAQLNFCFAQLNISLPSQLDHLVPSIYWLHRT
uniref:(California timema) hypothetical protein n=1 Tax=Timema californicum TaxID=61474 RepID=A0A7R9P5C4_TIMCA|nr:unnamed protein product [Timema californicum]